MADDKSKKKDCKHCKGKTLAEAVPCPECTTQDKPRVLIDGFTGVGVINAVTKCNERRPKAEIVIQCAKKPDEKDQVKGVKYDVGTEDEVRDRFIVANPEACILRKGAFMSTKIIINARNEQNARIAAGLKRAERQKKGGTGATRK